MLNTLLEYLKHPVTTLIEKSEEEDVKKSGIKLAIISGVLSLIGVISSFFSISSKFSKDGTYGMWYDSAEQIAEAKSEALKDAELFGSFLENWVIYAATIAIMALIFFIIAKLVKSERNYLNQLSMVNNSAAVFVAATLVTSVISLIDVTFFQIVGIVFLFATLIYVSYSLMYAYKDSLSDVDSDKLVLVTTAVYITIVVILLVINYDKIKLLSSFM